MTWLISQLTGIAASVWGFLFPLLRSQVAQFLGDKRVQSLALAFVEQAASIDLDGDGKHDHAVAQLGVELKAVGVEYSKAGLSLAVEAAYQKWQAQR